MRGFFAWIILAPFLCEAALTVTEDYQKGIEIARVYQKPILLAFTSSDWCEASREMDREIFHNPLFAKEISVSCIFVHIDFPELNVQSKECLTQNHALKELYLVEDFPTLILITPQGSEITRLGAPLAGAIPFAVQLKEIIFDYQEFDRTLALSNPEPSIVEKHYTRARELQSTFYTNQLLELGLQSHEGLFFPLEKYAQLIAQGEKHSLQAQELHRLILERTPRNQQAVRLRLALLDFQGEPTHSPHAIDALEEYIRDFKDQDHENLSRLQRIISEYTDQHQTPTSSK